ncbi:MAG: hypothetical protein HY956_01540 [Deltaproteobacteria bacterium]|nr:hypothetical protein [Deltaproteobacteria bacterium]
MKKLDLPFDADTINAEQVWTSGKYPFDSYVIIGLPKLKTVKERKSANLSPFGEKNDWRKQKRFIEALREEYRYLYSDPKNLYKID